MRQPLGATRSPIIADVLGHAVRIVLPGLLAGIAAAIAGNRLLIGLLFDVKPADPATLFAVLTGIAAASFAASFLPAFRASRLDPLVSLRKTNCSRPAIISLFAQENWMFNWNRTILGEPAANEGASS